MNKKDIAEFLEEKYIQYNNSNFIEDDPVKIPHEYTKIEDIEIAGLFASILAWGNRKSIIKNAYSILERMDNSPHEFILNHSNDDLKVLEGFKHRTFNSIDATTFVKSLNKIYNQHGSLGKYFGEKFNTLNDQAEVLSTFKADFFETAFAERSKKHLPDPLKGSAAKRMCMYFRWMVRKDQNTVDLGIWNDLIPTSKLHLPLDVHTGNVSRSLGLLQRKQNDWKAVSEITSELILIDPNDPVKFDFALFSLGVNEGFGK